MVCSIIPKKILKNIVENDPDTKRKLAYKSIIADTKEKEYREKRKQISKNLLKGIEPQGLDRSHTEHLMIYDNKSSWDYIKNYVWEEFKEKHPIVTRPRRIFTRDFDKVYDLFHDHLNRESFDNKNATVNIFLKYGSNFPNAYWDGEVLAFGAGDRYYFNDFSKIYDVIGHEYGHAITQYESNLQYEMQSGALNEHISDVFGICAYQKKYNIPVDKSEWLIGKGIFTKRVNGKGLRTFKNELAYDDPIIGRDEQPKFMSNYQHLPNNEDGDWGGVHINSGIPNHAFYLFNIKLGGKSWLNGSLKTWYNSMLKNNGLSPNATFKEFKQKTLLFTDKTEQLEKAWNEVGIY